MLDIESVPMGAIALDDQGSIIAVNQLALAANIWQYQPEIGTQLTLCIDNPNFLNWLSDPTRLAVTYPLYTECGNMWQCSMSPSEQGGVLLWLKNETELGKLKSKVKHLQRDIERLDFAAQGANLGIWDFNPSIGEIITNRTWVTQKKLNPDDLLAGDALFSEVVNGIERWAQLVHPDDLAEASAKIQAHLDGETDIYHAEFRIKCGDGNWKWILDQGRVFERDENDMPIRMNGIHVDVTKLKELQQNLSETKEKAEVANRAKSIFLANMSHELRTPLNAVLGYSQLMKSDARLTIQHQEYLEIINRSGEHLLSLINDVLDMSKIDAGHNEVEHKWFNFKEMIEEVRDLMQMKAMQKQIAFRCGLSSNTPHYVLADAAKIRQVLINLLSNAIKFTHNGSVSLEIESQCKDKSQYRVGFTVSDSGIGIEPENLERIFKPFEQVGSESAQNGTGLGLSISRQFVEMMDGALSVKSVHGEGSVFSFFLEVDSSEKLRSVNEPKGVQDRVLGLKQGAKSPRILVAEDQSDNQKLIMTLLSNAGFTAKLARDGEEAVALHQSWQPDFIWMDRRMPKMDGLQATKEIRRAPENSNVKIVALTASVFNDEIQEMLECGMDDFARKPFLPQDLFNMMKKHLDIEYDYQGASNDKQAQSTESPWSNVTLLQELPKDIIDKIVTAAEEGEQQALFGYFEQFIKDETARRELITLTDHYQFDDLIELFRPQP